MSRDEFIKRMKDLGWPDDLINDSIKTREEAAGEGIDIPYEWSLIEAPTVYPSGYDEE